MKKLDYIDGLKGIGALMVFFCHFVFAFYYAAYSLTGDAVNTNSGIEITIGKTPLNLLYSGNSAVCLFLVFSGFVLCLSYFHTRDKGRLKSAAWKRYFRLMPMILMINTVIFVLMSLGCYRNDEAAILTKSTVWFVGFNQFQPNFLQMLGESLAGCFLFGTNNYNGVLWTIPYLFSGALVVYLAAYLVGEHDFTSFASVHAQTNTYVRMIYALDVVREGDMIRIRVQGNGFLYNMVRIIAGTLIQVGAGIKKPEDMESILAGKDRELAGPTAPAHGLTMIGLEYL